MAVELEGDFDDGWVDGNVNSSHEVEHHSSSPDTIARVKSKKTKYFFIWPIEQILSDTYYKTPMTSFVA